MEKEALMIPIQMAGRHMVYAGAMLVEVEPPNQGSLVSQLNFTKTRMTVAVNHRLYFN